jgi:rhodanese-related sulfurtransferase
MTNSDDHRELNRGRGPSPLRVHTLRDPALGNRSYVVEVGGGAAITVDVPRHVHDAEAVATTHGLRIVAALDTHLHGDFVSGGRELAASHGTAVIAPAAAGLAFPHRKVADGTVILVGDVEVHAVATPGHGDEHVAYVVVIDSEPVAVFAGGLLGEAITDVTITDDDGDGDLDPDANGGPAVVDVRVRSSHAIRRIVTLDASVPAYLTHADANDGTWPSTVGEVAQQFQRRGGSASWPAETVRETGALRAVNRAGARLLDVLPPPRPLPARDVFRLSTTGTWLVDARPPLRWAGGHAPLALSVAGGPSFRRRLPHVVPPGAPVVLVTDEPGRPDRLVAEARACGHDHVVGWLDGGFPAWQAAGLPVAAADALAREAVPADAAIVDVRDNVAALDLRASHHLSLAALAAGDLPATAGQPLVVTSDDAAAAATAASILEARGITAAIIAPGR